MPPNSRNKGFWWPCYLVICFHAPSASIRICIVCRHHGKARRPRRHLQHGVQPIADSLNPIPYASLALAFAPSIILLIVMHRWHLRAVFALYANARMLVQLIVIGYVLTFIFETDKPFVVGAVLTSMILVAAWIALRPLSSRSTRGYVVSVAAIGAVGTTMLILVTQVVLDLQRWFEPRFVIPLAGMIFSNAMNTTSLAAERYQAERLNGAEYVAARRTALDAALIPQINALLAVGLVSLPGMMTGQILSGVEPLIAVRYQIMVMCMLFGASGLAAATYLKLQISRS